MGKRKQKTFETPEERAAWYAGYEARQRQLQARIEKIRAELAAKQQPQT